MDQNNFSNSLCCKVYLRVFFYCIVYLHKLPGRNWIPKEHRERIVCAFEDEAEDYLLVVDTLRVNCFMARGIVAQYIREGRIRERTRGGRNNVLAEDEMRQRLEDIINESCVVTLSQINGELRRRLPAKPLIHDQAADQSLEGMLFRVKLVRPVPVDRNRPDVLQKGKNMETESRTMPICTTVFLSMIQLQLVDCQESREGEAG